MKTSESITTIAPALLAAQQAITFAGKNARNPHFKNSYADLGSVIDACKEPLNSAGIVFMQMPTPGKDGELALVTRLIHTSGEWIEDTAVCPLPKQDPQGFGSAMTYLRRYSLAAIIGIYQDDDDGEAAKPKAGVEGINKWIAALVDAATMDDLRKHYSAAMMFASGDATAQRHLEAAKDKRKAELSVEQK